MSLTHSMQGILILMMVIHDIGFGLLRKKNFHSRGDWNVTTSDLVKSSHMKGCLLEYSCMSGVVISYVMKSHNRY